MTYYHAMVEKQPRPPKRAAHHMLIMLHRGELSSKEACSAMTAIWPLLPSEYTAAAH